MPQGIQWRRGLYDVGDYMEWGIERSGGLKGVGNSMSWGLYFVGTFMPYSFLMTRDVYAAKTYYVTLAALLS